MYRDTSLMYELCTDLKEHRYINHDSYEILTDSQEKRINEYIDDLTIDLFFRLAPLKNIVISPETCKNCGNHYTVNGIKPIETQIELNLEKPLDRYTFLSIITHPWFFQNKFPKEQFNDNKFITELYSNNKRFGATGASFTLQTGLFGHPYLDAFFHEYRIIDFDNNRASMFYCLRDFMQSYEMERKYDINIYPSFLYSMSDYPQIKNEEIFPNITLEYVLSLYVILVEKLQFYEKGIGSLIAFGLDKKLGDFSHPLQLFHNFELRLNNLFRKEEILIEDLYLRFVNPENSKAFKIDFHKPSEDLVTIKLFNQETIKDQFLYNSLPLPFFYKKLYK